MNNIARRCLPAFVAACGLIGAAHAELAGSPAPDFVLKATSGKNYRLSEYRGEVVLVAFFASWCGECRTQLEALAGLNGRYAGSDLEMLAVSLDRDRDDAGDAARAVGLNFPALHDAGGSVGELYDVDKLPFVVLVDRDGVVREEIQGYRKGEEDRYLERVRSLLED